jgi:hypothetical protein
MAIPIRKKYSVLSVPHSLKSTLLIIHQGGERKSIAQVWMYCHWCWNIVCGLDVDSYISEVDTRPLLYRCRLTPKSYSPTLWELYRSTQTKE